MYRSSIPKLLLALLLLPLALRSQELVDGIAAIVGDKIILKSSVAQLAQMNALQSGINLAANPQLAERLQADAFENLVLQNILLARAKVDSLDIIPDEDVDQALEQQVASIIAQIGSEERFEEVVGQTLRDFRRDRWYDIRDQIIAERYQQEKVGGLTVTRGEVTTFFETYRDSLPAVDAQIEFSQLILQVLPGDSARDQAYTRIHDLRRQIVQGAALADLARLYSDDPASADRGGELGFVRRGVFVPAFEEAAFGLAIGQLSEVVETPFGFHVIEVLEKQGERISARHILVAITPTEADRQSALTRVRDYYYLLEAAPALFDSLVQVLSEEENASPDLGYIGWLEMNRLPEDAYRAAVFGVLPGEVTPPFESNAAFHMLKVLGIKDGGAPTLEDYYPQLEAFALRDKQAKYLENWIARVRKEVFIKTMY